MKLLACNVGSTSLKFKLFDMPKQVVLVQARFESIGAEAQAVYLYENLPKEISFVKEHQSVPSYKQGIEMFLRDLAGKESGIIDDIGEIECVGFKTVLAKNYYGIHELNDDVMEGMQQYMNVAGTHNGPYMDAINQLKALLPKAKMVGVFETSFHTTIPLHRRLYPVPYEWYEKFGIQRMGYHGASHGYIAERITSESKEHRVISCHLGGSCSLCAIKDGKSVDTSFGFSLQTGVLHASRCGDIDPYIIPFLLGEGYSTDKILTGLSKQGGLLGISGLSNDLRVIEGSAEQNERCALALEVFYTSVVRYIGAFYAELGGLDYLVFTGGIGENSARTRLEIINRVRHLGINLDENANEKGAKERIISTIDSKVKALVIPTDEELIVAKRTYEYYSRTFSGK